MKQWLRTARHSNVYLRFYEYKKIEQTLNLSEKLKQQNGF